MDTTNISSPSLLLNLTSYTFYPSNHTSSTFYPSNHTSHPFASPQNSTFSPNNQQHPSCVDYFALQTPLALLYSIIFALGLTGNLIALWVFFRVHGKKNSVRVFLINVAFADLLLVICLPFRIVYHSRGNVWSLGPTLCKAVGTIFYMNMYISVTMLGLISIDRYMKINRGAGGVQKRCFRSTRWSCGLCASVWLAACCFTLTLLLSKNHEQTDRCFHYKHLMDSKWKAYINICMLLLFWSVFFSLLFSYVKISLKLLRSSRQKPDLPNASRYAKIAKKSFFILVLFTICFVPYHTVRVFYIHTQITNSSCVSRRIADVTNEIALLLSALNSCLDPALYFLLSSSVRKEVVRLMTVVFCTREAFKVSGSSSTNDDLDGRDSKSDRQQTRVSLISNLKEKVGKESTKE